ncbi:hypothetical protein RHSIM_Rhsim04G0194500 [Rhododendron simsii]|uniref:F-box domain-containing protein n=1 Tax=Rhododendron simsii TaxID=118357 RepID=A0A834H245_RHOSS|nr:hypothetical protein RHSIM_Rhsim04G0194500 [Rhododendron simsii]
MRYRNGTLRFSSGSTRGITNEGYLPREIWVDILTRLPAKMAGQCKCVCKNWRALIEEPSFVELHHFPDYEGGLAQHLFSYPASDGICLGGVVHWINFSSDDSHIGVVHWRNFWSDDSRTVDDEVVVTFDLKDGDLG